MFVIITINEDDEEEYFSMLAGNGGIYVDTDIKKAVIFSTSAIASKQKDVLDSFNPEDTFVVKEIVLQDLQS